MTTIPPSHRGARWSAHAALGLVLALPWLGHASWHAYRALVDADSLPERLPPEGGA